ncbi:hypothetical protein [Rhizobium leguminosarum]|uniref:hypothetical protein n=1 Tax=Rhizobium leguminosarum TaxID=384 RepID=UPI001607E283|nr:hypothetical protein [Rhizobium leguminosarum]MBB4327825.1 hypothetical protein [Rhizobium leguminosarum]MBB4353490.1 hypothetical protein [Rhizobium leguminosarum]MBB4548439.1 hypothetical protein [Rhizobium leguminosarum]MBB4561454.1 hypothetical protein [Rhizobium leguminosarum]
MARSILENRIVKLEGRNPARPYEHLTDEELAARLAAIAVRIEAEAGVKMADYVEALAHAVGADEPLPEGMTRMEIRSLIASFRNVASTRSHHAQ